MKSIAFLLISVVFGCATLSAQQEREYYALEVYSFKNENQFKRLNNYLSTLYHPALRNAGYSKVGFFHTLETDTAGKAFYVLIPIKSIGDIEKLENAVAENPAYRKSAVHHDSLYERKQVILLHAFRLAPTAKVPDLQNDRTKRIYELRSYESRSDSLYRNKVKMFNEGGEIDLFQRLKFNAVFYGEVIAGANMPNLMYMTSFEDRLDRDAHWKAFGADAEWKQLSAKPEYQGNVSHIDITFLVPTPYSYY